MAITSTEKAGANTSWLATDVPVVVALGPLLFLIWMCLQLHVDVPFGDQWELIPRLNRLDAGTLSFRDLWGQHSEHRPMIPLLIMLGLASLTGWNIDAEIAVNVLLGIGIFAVAYAAVHALSKHAGVPRWWLLPVLSLLIFSPGQFENWLWGWQIQLLLGVLAGVAGAWFLADPSRAWWRFALALVCGVVGTYSFASGLTFWIVGAAAFWLRPAGWRRPAIWAIVAGATIASYFIDYHPNPGHPPMSGNFADTAAVMRLLTYVAKYIGSPVAAYQSAWAAAAGVLGLGLFAALAWRARTTGNRQVFVFACLAGLNAIAGAILSGLGRSGFGSDQALTPRYETIAAPLWMAVTLLLPIAAPSRAVAMVGAVALSAAILVTGQAGYAKATVRARELRPLRVALYGRWNWEYVARLYLNDARAVKERAAVLRMLKMSVYRDDRY